MKWETGKIKKHHKLPVEGGFLKDYQLSLKASSDSDKPKSDLNPIACNVELTLSVYKGEVNKKYTLIHEFRDKTGRTLFFNPLIDYKMYESALIELYGGSDREFLKVDEEISKVGSYLVGYLSGKLYNELSGELDREELRKIADYGESFEKVQMLNAYILGFQDSSSYFKPDPNQLFNKDGSGPKPMKIEWEDD